MPAILVILLAVFLAGLGGCVAKNPPPADTAAAQPPDQARAVHPGDENPRLSVFERPAERLVVEFQVHRVSAPRGAFGEGSQLWSIVTGGLPRAAEDLQLQANGMKAAVGRQSDRAALLTWLEQIDAPRVADDRILPDEARMVELELGDCAPRENVFYYDHEGALRGQEFVSARARLRLLYEMRTTNLREIWLHLVPELEEPPGQPKWELLDDGTARQVPQRRVKTFDHLTFSARIPEGGFLLLGPAPGAYRAPLLGRTFFVEGLRPENEPQAVPHGDERENLYIISPIVRAQRQDVSTDGDAP